MAQLYKLSPLGVLRATDNANIPNAAGNRDWQAYQDWLTQGNTPTRKTHRHRRARMNSTRSPRSNTPSSPP